MAMKRIICAFPGSGKTYATRQGHGLDLDRGKVRNMLGLDFNDEHDHRKTLDKLYINMIRAASKVADIIFVNEPHVKFPSGFDVDFFVPPAGTREQWYARIIDRGDDPNAEWLQYVYEHFDECVRDWIAIAEENDYGIWISDEYLTDSGILSYDEDEEERCGYNDEKGEIPCTSRLCPCDNEECIYSPVYDY